MIWFYINVGSRCIFYIDILIILPRKNKGQHYTSNSNGCLLKRKIFARNPTRSHYQRRKNLLDPGDHRGEILSLRKRRNPNHHRSKVNLSPNHQNAPRKVRPIPKRRKRTISSLKRRTKKKVKGIRSSKNNLRRRLNNNRSRLN